MTPGAIHIATRPQYLADRSAPDEQHYVFAYTITIRNDGNERVRLISRRWLITDANGKKIEVEGSGVVGEQPRIAPGEEYTYTSGVSLETPVGVMEGSYTMVLDDGREFQAPIAAFRLAMPNLIN
ncbi:Co2+/Mg2+ efflux protein ApaG [Zobellella denitrificans]|uniref:Protein ApaG n=1 Tax=Zobellella denitrificans TaxID=347534 RepID=A0A231MWZ7_9GAMM|nr:Co2+/Mg2+ efflux protein ApaG [Zobellella denitrificans]ATG73065.1 protein ApaG [Zobellella denitrificans]OXS14763.1 Co2+/Mg2+ efflux protein ApaG [Zobellella denitrificans]